MSDGIHSDPIISPAIMLERQLFTMRLELEEIRDGISRPSNMALVETQLQQMRDIARLSAEVVQAVYARRVGG